MKYRWIYISEQLKIIQKIIININKYYKNNERIWK